MFSSSADTGSSSPQADWENRGEEHWCGHAVDSGSRLLKSEPGLQH